MSVICSDASVFHDPLTCDLNMWYSKTWWPPLWHTQWLPHWHICFGLLVLTALPNSAFQNFCQNTQLQPKSAFQDHGAPWYELPPAICCPQEKGLPPEQGGNCTRRNANMHVCLPLIKARECIVPNSQDQSRRHQPINCCACPQHQQIVLDQFQRVIASSLPPLPIQWCIIVNPLVAFVLFQFSSSLFWSFSVKLGP